MEQFILLNKVMIFKSIRYLVYSSLILVVGNEKIYDVDISDPAIDKYDNYEVIGIRSNYYDHEEYIVVSLKPTVTSYYEYNQKE